MPFSMQGLILKGVGGFYTVETAKGVYECRARGIFRREGVTPAAGDRVEISAAEDGTGTVEAILPRRNFLERPPVANLDQLVIVVSVREPEPNPLVIDRMIAAAECRGVEPLLVISKTDLSAADGLCEIYRGAGIGLRCVSSVTGEGVGAVRELLKGKITAFAGNTGVGKSSLLNTMFRSLNLETGEISRRLGRGRHTTRRVELFRLEGGGYVADTPGFSSFVPGPSGGLTKEKLPYCFREFTPYLGRCRFTSCSHTCEKGCAVLEAVESGRISRSRHQSYVALYREMKDWNEWGKKEKSAL